mmetsp:Transcript_134490/g.335505  ORF Transcript_134490/g.335505 Transcript_134490/m.335505 type:complete len:318 (-) Transcript_134490:64-1017(-)|eukprot:CAMPEP_0115699808 /NCGR_PEP_ID=MMETSP0272-20121206/67075_1 /TAXON_ID=71861 /ORGANISM="Scrippsiella trochoidea, Strain CCMP3099" /LENGTH=317 /DNA_ID=CAMNT_0003140255 /DNA_START=8 /DNA_END=958 /DNA_ORIENTATION=+
MAVPYAIHAALSILVPICAGEAVPFGPRPLQEVACSLVLMTCLCGAAGWYLTRSSPLLLRIASHFHDDLRDEAWDEVRLGPGTSMDADRVPDEEADQKYGRKPAKKRTATELLFIGVHNSAVTLLALLAWLLASPTLALHAFCLEVGYEIFDAVSLGMQRLEPETLIHHIVSPICILCSTQTKVDYRVLCHLCICIDLSGAILGYSKFLLRYAHVSTTRVYQNLTWVYGALRVVGPIVDTVIIAWHEISTKGWLFNLGVVLDDNGMATPFPKTDMMQLYFWAMAVLNSFNIYFFCVIRSRARMNPHLAATLERTGCH